MQSVPSLPSPHSLVMDRSDCATSLSLLVVVVRCILSGLLLLFCFVFFLPVMLPFEIPKLPTDTPVRWLLCGNFSFTVPAHDGSLSLNLLSLFLSFTFCPTSF